MNWRPHAFLLAFATMVHVAGGADAPTRGPQAAESTPATSPGAPRERTVSPATAARLADATPTFIVPASDSAEPAEPREPGEPRTTIIRLPRFVVDEPKVRVPDEYAILTPKGWLDLAHKRHPGLKFGPASWLNGPIGLAMMEEDQRLSRLVRMAELANFLGFAQQPPTDYAYRLIHETFTRGNGWIGSGGSFQLSR